MTYITVWKPHEFGNLFGFTTLMQSGIVTADWIIDPTDDIIWRPIQMPIVDGKPNGNVVRNGEQYYFSRNLNDPIEPVDWWYYPETPTNRT